MRETLQQAAKKLLSEPVGTERTIAIHTGDGLTGAPSGVPQRGLRLKNNVVRVDVQTKEGGKKRAVVVSSLKGTVIAAGDWE